MFELLNEMLELIYIADIETYDLLFMNTIGRERFNVDKVDGLKCYQALQGLDAPCPFCNNKILKFDETYSWAFTNNITNCHYLLKDKLIYWEGKVARVEIAIDDTESENEKIALKKALDGEKVVMECAKQLYNASNITSTISNVLEQIGTFLNAERTYIFEICNKEMFNTYEWCAPGVKPQIENLQHLDISLIDSWMPKFSKRECVIIESLEEPRRVHKNLYLTLERQGIENLVVAPLEKDGEIVGYVGVDNPRNNKIINIAPLFRTLSYFIMTTMRRTADEERLAKLSYYDMLTGFYNRNRFMQDMAQSSDHMDSVGVAYLDINGLKDINDKYGHFRGDQTLSLCAQKMVESFGIGDFYRIGGDEFIIICKYIDEQKFVRLAENMKKAFESGSECHVAIGYQWEKRTNDIQNLIFKADAMMYEEKERYYQKNPPTARYRRWE